MSKILLSLSLLALMVFAAGCGRKPVANASSEDEANEMIDVLREEGLAVEKEEVAATDGGGGDVARQWRVVVNEGWFGGDDAVTRAVRVLRDNGLPRPVDKGFEGAYDEKSIIPSESAQRTQRMKELKTEIERQLRLLPGVTRVSVIIVPPEDKSISFDKHEPTASVVMVRKEQSPPLSEADVQQIVAKGVPDLKAENVSVRLSTQIPRPPPRRDPEGAGRNKLLLAGGTGLVIVLGAMLVFVLLQVRQQRRTIAQLRAGAEVPRHQDEAAEENEGAAILGEEPRLVTKSAPGVNHQRQWLEEGTNGESPSSSSRLLEGGGSATERAS
jgi:type III secretion protein J